MIVDDLKLGQIFTIDNTIVYPKMKLRKGFIDMRTQYVYLCRVNEEARLLSESQLRSIRSDWGMSQEEFDKYKGRLVKRYDVKM